MKHRHSSSSRRVFKLVSFTLCVSLFGTTVNGSRRWLNFGLARFQPSELMKIALPLMLAVAMVIYAERKIWAAIALRRGPNVVGPFGLLQSFADLLKFVFKEPVLIGVLRGVLCFMSDLMRNISVPTAVTAVGESR